MLSSLNYFKCSLEDGVDVTVFNFVDFSSSHSSIRLSYKMAILIAKKSSKSPLPVRTIVILCRSSHVKINIYEVSIGMGAVSHTYCNGVRICRCTELNFGSESIFVLLILDNSSNTNKCNKNQKSSQENEVKLTRVE